MNRRDFLNRILTSGFVVASSAGLYGIGRGVAAESVDPLGLRTESEVLRALFGAVRPTPHTGIAIEAPNQAVAGEPITVLARADLEGVRTIAIVTENNLYPLNTFVRIADAVGYYRSRINVEQSSSVRAYFEAIDGVYYASTSVKVSAGGYGMTR